MLYNIFVNMGDLCTKSITLPFMLVVSPMVAMVWLLWKLGLIQTLRFHSTPAATRITPYNACCSSCLGPLCYQEN